jgi:hypothetical protein
MHVWLLIFTIFCPTVPLGETPSISFQTRHNPFEPVYLWQFLQCLVVLAVAIYLDLPENKELRPQAIPTVGRVSQIGTPITPRSSEEQDLLTSDEEEEQKEIITPTLEEPTTSKPATPKKRNKHTNKDKDTIALKQLSVTDSQETRKSHNHKKLSRKSIRSSRTKSLAERTLSSIDEEEDEDHEEDSAATSNRGSKMPHKPLKLHSHHPHHRKAKDIPSATSNENASGAVKTKGSKTISKSQLMVESHSHLEKKELHDEEEEEVEADAEEEEEYEAEAEEEQEEEEEFEAEEEEEEEETQERAGAGDSHSQNPHNHHFRMSIAEALETLLMERLIPCLEMEHGLHLPQLPTPLPNLRDMWDVFEGLYGRPWVSGTEFTHFILPHLKPVLDLTVEQKQEPTEEEEQQQEQTEEEEEQQEPTKEEEQLPCIPGSDDGEGEQNDEQQSQLSTEGIPYIFLNSKVKVGNTNETLEGKHSS